MNKFLSAVLAVVMSFGLATVSFDAEAKRIGGGRSFGVQRQATPPKAPTQNTTAAGAAGAAAKKNSWMGPLAGIAAGLGLAALASHLGMGEAFANILLIGLLVMAGLAVFGFIMRKRAAQQGGMTYAAAGVGASHGGGFNAPSSPQQSLRESVASAPVTGSSIGSGIGAHVNTSASNTGGHIPADFDVDGFVRNAKVNYIRLQAANDAGNLDDIRAFTTPEMFAEIQMDIVERGGAAQSTEVLQLNAEVIDVAEESALYIVSVRFSGDVRENGETVQVNEIWHLSKPRHGGGGWVVAGIQQVS